ncbi:menaquinol-cytochrome c reductase, iron-sulfur subunit [Plesiocystis pacifica SIR-1]|uniref:Menaquinol-cytochrome c reductase, iron-sulfur subunit n=1 Tax=Plesiocystis pacifica SIR-1 TaxID=391625 RepID=A6GGF9_9BACT|nr:ubiquinol-cytochrome c reductase iron-sulfur subunit [Plesiocystis pacifica]EDM75035.1 menaquinol-cytochrome c reductase, iron-sulfur subunit [Plesiocystis pacifica SIR-1]
MSTDDQDSTPEAKSPTPAAHGGEDEGRRTFMKVGVGALGAGLAGIVVAPALKYTLWPLAEGTEVTSGGDDFAIVGQRSEFGPEPVKVDIYADRVDAWNKTRNVKIGSAWVVEREGQLVAFSTVCPHLGCAVDYSPEDSKFKCPCHRSAFGLDGAPEEGPAPRSLDALELSNDEDGGGLISIRYERFKQGTEDKVKIG